MKSPISPFVRSAALAASIALCLGQAAHAVTYYWDTNDSTPGFGNATGTWGTDAFWSTNSTGTTSTANTTITTADNVNFGTTSNPLVVGSINGPATPQGFLTMTFGNPSGNAIGLVGGTLNLAPTSTITASNTGNNNIISTVLQGSGSNLIKNGSGSLRLQGSSANTYSGLTTVSFGTLFLDKTAGVTAIAGNMILDGQSTVQNETDNQIADTATVTLANTNAQWKLNGKTETIDTLTLTGNIGNTMGFTTGTAGKLTVNNLNVNASGAGGVTLNSAGSGNQSTITATTVTNTGGTWVFGTLSGTQSLVVGSGGLTIGGGSTIAVNATAGSANFISLGGNVTSQANAIANIISGAGTLRLNDTRTFDVADGAAASDLTISTIVANGTGTGAITKTGAGTMTLSGNNTYTGATTVSAGTLILSGSVNTTSGVTVGANGTLANNSSVAYNKALSLTEGGVFNGNGTFTPTAMTITADLTGASFTTFALGSALLTKAGNLELTLSGITAGTYTLFSGGTPSGAFSTMTIGGSLLTSGGSGNFSGVVLGDTYTFTNANNQLVVAVPEPVTWALLAAGLTVVVTFRRRRD